jgi:8-oxo-dGTP pyrophosphatase MutT (NUDIX family)
MIRAAGILFLTPDRKALLLQRSLKGNHAGEWCFPGGSLESGETAEEAAIRECREETGHICEGALIEHTRRIAVDQPATGVVPPAHSLDGSPSPVLGEQVDFTTFVSKLGSEFIPELNDEHIAYAWAPIDSPPEPLHPGCRIALQRFGMDELGVARAIAAGDLISPQRYTNMALFALRITGTGVALRRKHNEWVHRPPEEFLNEEFLARCNGLAVIWIHPKKAVLDSKEFNERVVGTIMLPYIQGNEVWGIAKIYDAAAITEMATSQLSTSPGVVLWPDHATTTATLEDGRKLLIEGSPFLLDHLAVVEKGVWDKLGDPSGVRSEIIGDEDVTEAERKAAEKARADADEKLKEEMKDPAKKDAEGGEFLDKLLTHVDGLMTKHCDVMGKRMDAMEEEFKKERKDRADAAKKDNEEEEKKKADAAKADAAKSDAAKADAGKEPPGKDPKEPKGDAEEEEKKKADAAKADAAKADAAKKDAAKADADAATIADVLKEVADLRTRIPKDVTDADHAALTDAQSRADGVFNELGQRAPRPMLGETVGEYEHRVGGILKVHSKQWKDIDLSKIGDSATFKIALGTIYADAQEAGRHPTDLQPGELRQVTRIDRGTGRTVHEFFGANSFVNQFKAPARLVTFIGTRKDR